MTLDEAIAHHERAMEESEGDVATRHWQHAMWLKELKVLRMENARLRRECDFYFSQVEENEQRHKIAYDRLALENDKLRELVRLMAERDSLLLCDHGCTPHTCKAYDSDVCESIGHLSDELGIEVDA